MMINVHKQNYLIGGVKVTAVADFGYNVVNLFSSNGRKWHGKLDEYTDYEGDMEDFAKDKLQLS